MKKVEISKLECHFPTLFKVMWLSAGVWIIACLWNYLHPMLIPQKLDDFGLCVLFLFTISLFICFGKGIKGIVSRHGLLIIDLVAKKVALYVFMISYTILLILTIWDICAIPLPDGFSLSTWKSHQLQLTRNGGSLSIQWYVVTAVIGNTIKAAIVAIVTVAFYMYVKIFFYHLFRTNKEVGHRDGSSLNLAGLSLSEDK